MHSFRCRNCGHLHAAGAAGVNDLPHACAVCGGGVAFDARGNKTVRRDNWEVLAAATPARVEELGLAAAHVVRHDPAGAAERVRVENLERSKAALAQLDAKKKRWETDKDAIVKQVWALQDEVTALKTTAATQLDRDDHAGYADTVNKTSALNDKITDLVNSEWTPRDVAAAEELRAAIAADGHPRGRIKNQHVRGGIESVFSRDRS